MQKQDCAWEEPCVWPRTVQHRVNVDPHPNRFSPPCSIVMKPPSAILLLAWALTFSTPTAAAVSSAATPPPVSQARVAALQQQRFGMFICWSFSTFSGKEWTGGVDNVSFFRATDCDTDQWARTAKEAGMGYILFLTKHHDGFCLWDTATTERKVTKAPLGRDVLAELRRSCKKYGIKLALYFSEGDWTWPGAVDGKGWTAGIGKNPAMKQAQLRELLTQYGPVEYIWFDHAVGDGGLSHAETIAYCKALQPECFIGFNHGEQEGADIRLGEMGRPGPLDDHQAAGPHMKDAPAKSYRLAEFTYPILPKHQGGAMWFYSLPRHDGLCHPAEKIYADYLGAVKYGNIFSLDVGPDYAGKLRDIDVQTLRRVGAMIRAKAPLPAGSSLLVGDAVDWESFLRRHDPIWETLPARFDDGAFLGNGLLGAMIHRDGDNRLRWEIGRADVTEHRRDNHRLPIGGLVLETRGKIQSGTIRLDLWNAEIRGTVVTDQGKIQFRTLIHTDVLAMILELETTGGESGASFVWRPGHGQDPRNQRPGQPARFPDPLNPPATTETIDGLPVCIQARHAGGEFATAWQEIATPQGRRVILSVADSFPGQTARREAVATVRQTAEASFDGLLASHRTWWHAMYPKSFVSVPDPKLESFYWIQFYKLASASRPDRVPVDLLGPWYRDTGWPRIWWNLNIQTLYLPVYAANQLELGESFVRFLDTKRANFVRNAKELYGLDDGATVPHTTDYEGLRGDGSSAPDKFINPGDFTWALHNYYLHYRHTMDHTLITDQSRHAFYPLLRGSINVYLRILKPGADGKLHLPIQHSPEYGEAADNNYNLSLLRWGCQTLLELNTRYRLNDPLAPRWQEVLDRLVPYPVDENGLRIGADVAFTKSHRHWSHLLMVHPLHILDAHAPANRDLLYKSIHHWLTVDGSRGVYGWSRAAAASLYSALGDGDNALASIHQHMADQRFVRPNTMYIEGSPVIECSVVLARSLQDMLLQSHSGTVRVFPAIPAAWKDAVFHNLRKEGAFLVSAERKNGQTRWVRLQSLAGEPCRIAPALVGAIKSTPQVALRDAGQGCYELTLAKGEEVLLYTEDKAPRPVVVPLASPPGEINPWGTKTPRPAGGKTGAAPNGQGRASSVWGPGYEADKAFDGNDTTRWGAAPDAHSGWLEIDLGRETRIGRAVVKELGFQRTQEFALEFRAGDVWQSLHRGTTIAGERIYDFSPVNARYVRLNIIAASGVPTIEEFQVLPPGTVAPAAATPRTPARATPAAPPPPPDPAREARLQWFHEAKYGFFINWGLYSIPAGEWKGKPIAGIGEWIMNRAKIPMKEYEQLAARFTPAKFDAEAWAQLAHDAGMKYVVFDCTHHDGFALYRSEISKYNCYDATPWKRDPFKELQAACAKRGLKLCFYYSQAQDWHEPNGAGNDWDFGPDANKDFDQYLRTKALPQVRELLTRYGPIGLIWFDTPRLMTPERSKQLADLVRSIQPDTLINSRLGPGGHHDYQSRGDNEIPHRVTSDAWETAATVNDTWGYKKDDHNWKSPEDICFKLVDIVSKGGNDLLNVGPDADGFIPQPSQDVLRKVGAWLKVNGEAIYGAGRTPFGDELGTVLPGPMDKRGQPPFAEKKEWRCTTKPGKLYVHLFKWPGAPFELSGVTTRITKAFLLADRDRTALRFTQAQGRVTIDLPAEASDAIASVVCIEHLP